MRVESIQSTKQRSPGEHHHIGTSNRKNRNSQQAKTGGEKEN
jgi:hypothetical protein